MKVFTNKELRDLNLKMVKSLMTALHEVFADKHPKRIDKRTFDKLKTILNVDGSNFNIYSFNQYGWINYSVYYTIPEYREAGIENRRWRSDETEIQPLYPDVLKFEDTFYYKPNPETIITDFISHFENSIKRFNAHYALTYLIEFKKKKDKIMSKIMNQLYDDRELLESLFNPLMKDYVVDKELDFEKNEPPLNYINTIKNELDNSLYDLIRDIMRFKRGEK